MEDVNARLLESVMSDILTGGNLGHKDIQRLNQAKLISNKDKGNVDDNGMAAQIAATMNEKARLRKQVCPHFVARTIPVSR